MTTSTIPRRRAAVVPCRQRVGGCNHRQMYPTSDCSGDPFQIIVAQIHPPTTTTAILASIGDAAKPGQRSQRYSRNSHERGSSGTTGRRARLLLPVRPGAARATPQLRGALSRRPPGSPHAPYKAPPPTYQLPAYQLPWFGMERHGSLAPRAAPACNSSMEMPSGSRTKAIRPSRGGRKIATPASMSRRQLS